MVTFHCNEQVLTWKRGTDWSLPAQGTGAGLPMCIDMSAGMGMDMGLGFRLGPWAPKVPELFLCCMAWSTLCFHSMSVYAKCKAQNAKCKRVLWRFQICPKNMKQHFDPHPHSNPTLWLLGHPSPPLPLVGRKFFFKGFFTPTHVPK